MKMFKSMTRPKPHLVISWRQEACSFFLHEGSANLKYQSGNADSNLKEFLGPCRPERTILVIPRSEVLQKEMMLTRSDNDPQNLEAKLAQFLPCPPAEMACSLAVDFSDGQELCKGLLYAIPESKINALLKSFDKSGIKVDEIVSEDQALFWLFCNKTPGPVLVFDQTSERTLFLALKENGLLLSQAYPPDEELRTVISEASFRLLEAGIKPVKICLTPGMNASDFTKAFDIPVEAAETETSASLPIPPVLLGAKHWGEFPVLSLLPNSKKILRRHETRDKQLKAALMALGFFIGSFILLTAGHWFFLTQKKSALEKETAKLSSDVSNIRRMTELLDTANDSERSKERLLRLFQELAERAPSSVRLKELQFEDKGIAFQGESPSHALLTDMLQVFEKIEGVEDAKLEHARLRKRLNQDFFDFELSAQWKN